MLYAVLAIVFAVPFLDPRRPLRLLHLDVLFLSVFPLYFLRYMDGVRYTNGGFVGSIRWAVILASIGLAYIFARMVAVAIRNRSVAQQLVPIVPMQVLVVATVLLMAVHLAFPRLERPLGLSSRPVIDVGLASVLGADQILDGRDVYGGKAYRQQIAEYHPDTYGPMTYLAYVPFAYIYRDDVYRAARLAADFFDVLVAVGMFVLGRRLAAGVAGTRLGIVLAYAWAAYPCAFFATIWAYNDALVALVLVGAMLAATFPARAGFLVGLGVATKFVCLIVAPLFATVRRPTIRSAVAYVGCAVLAIAAVTLPLLPPGGLSELYDRTVGWQLTRGSTNSIWGQVPGIEWLLVPVRAAAVIFALAIALVPRRKTLHQVAALGAAAIVLCELSLNHWLPSYVLWFTPLALIAIFGRFTELERPRDREERLPDPASTPTPACAPPGGCR
jgi:hypothetical protein